MCKIVFMIIWTTMGHLYTLNLGLVAPDITLLLFNRNVKSAHCTVMNSIQGEAEIRTTFHTIGIYHARQDIGIINLNLITHHL